MTVRFPESRGCYRRSLRRSILGDERMKHRILQVGFLLVCAGSLYNPAQVRAQTETQGLGQGELLITAVQISGNTLTISGENFFSLTPIVRLGKVEDPLIVQSITDVLIVATLPGVPPGDYLLIVSCGPTLVSWPSSPTGTFDLTIPPVGLGGIGGGVAGPSSPPGPLGLMGAQGPGGPSGPSGPVILDYAGVITQIPNFTAVKISE